MLEFSARKRNWAGRPDGDRSSYRSAHLKGGKERERERRGSKN